MPSLFVAYVLAIFASPHRKSALSASRVVADGFREAIMTSTFAFQHGFRTGIGGPLGENDRLSLSGERFRPFAFFAGCRRYTDIPTDAGNLPGDCSPRRAHDTGEGVVRLSDVPSEIRHAPFRDRRPSDPSVSRPVSKRLSSPRDRSLGVEQPRGLDHRLPTGEFLLDQRFEARSVAADRFHTGGLEF